MNEINPITQNLTFLYEKKGCYNEEIPLLVMNKFVSYNNPDIASEIDCNFFKVDEEINKQRLLLKLPKQKTPFITFFKRLEQEEEFEFLFEKIKHYYKMSSKDFDKIKDYYLKLLEDKTVLREYFKFFGIEKSKYLEYNISFKKKIKGLNDYD